MRKAHGIYKTLESGGKSAPARGAQLPRKSAPLPEEKVEIPLRDDEDDVPEPPSFKSSEPEQAEDAAPEPEQSVPSIPMSPELAASMTRAGFDPMPIDANDMPAFVAAEAPKWLAVAKSAGVRGD